MTEFLLAFLELTFVMVFLLLLHGLRETIGKAAFYLTLSFFLIFGQVITALGLEIHFGVPGLTLELGRGVLLSPYLVALLVVYIVDGTLEAQRVIVGFLCVVLSYYTLSGITAAQCVWLAGDVSSASQSIEQIVNFVNHSRDVMGASFAAYGIDLFTVPIVYQLFRNLRMRLVLCVLATAFFAQAIDVFVFELLIAGGQQAEWWLQVRSTYIARALSMVWLSAVVSLYLSMRNYTVGEERRTLDIVLSFLGGYNRARALQRHIREWEGRYRVVVEQSNELIFILDHRGVVLHANRAACEVLQRSQDQIQRHSLFELVSERDGTAIEWDALWQQLRSVEAPHKTVTGVPVVQRYLKTQTPQGGEVSLDAQLSLARLSENPVAVFSARDVTERERMEQERQRLQEQLIHSQRLEALGHLAGGVAHDFNNMLHTIQNSLDSVKRKWRKQNREEVPTELDNIDTALNRSSELTTQLLGFARRGKYRMEELRLPDLMEETRALFEPVAGRRVEFKMLPLPESVYIHGDETQLQQVLLNILVNARDAVEEKDDTRGRIVFRAEIASEGTPGWLYCPRYDARPEEYVCIRIKDNGTGINEDVRNRLFEPFFTTKPVGKGTGMGLAMAYGCIANHNGWIHLETERDNGTEFFLFLPRI